MTSVILNSVIKSPKEFTLIVVREKEDLVLLGYKKRGFGVGKWHGFGGKVEPGETVLECAKRELQEECGLIAKSFMKNGVLWFEDPSWSIDTQLSKVHLFTATEYEGEVKESEEMRPQWFKCNDIPYNEMFASSKLWLPKTLEGKKFNAFFEMKNLELLDFKVIENDSNENFKITDALSKGM